MWCALTAVGAIHSRLRAPRAWRWWSVYDDPLRWGLVGVRLVEGPAYPPPAFALEIQTRCRSRVLSTVCTFLTLDLKDRHGLASLTVNVSNKVAGELV